jgi:hypothetical protein
VDKFAEKICQKGIVIRIPPHYFSKIRFSYIKAFGLSSLEKLGELKLLSFTQILFMAVKRLDFCQLLLEIYVKKSNYLFSITVPNFFGWLLLISDFVFRPLTLWRHCVDICSVTKAVPSFLNGYDWFFYDSYWNIIYTKF